MRTFGVEEELLLVETSALEPLSAGEWTAGLPAEASATGHEITMELQQEQIEVVGPPQATLAGQLEAILAGRALADRAARRAGGRVVALATPPGGMIPHLVPKARYQRIGHEFGVTAREHLTNGLHVHVAVADPEEAITALDRIRVWLPTLLALSANSPFWQGADTSYASYRHRLMSRWPVSGPTEVFGSAAAYARHRRQLLDSGIPLDAGMFYYDARPSEHQPTLEVRVPDVPLDPTEAAVIAALVRALVETALRQARTPPPDVPASLLRAWSWLASRSGVEDRLIDPATGMPAPSGDVVSRLLDTLRPVLAEHGEEGPVETVVAGILREGPGARVQRLAYGVRCEVRDVVAAALEATHRVRGVPGLAPAASRPAGAGEHPPGPPPSGS
ncbi:YbdK family carboxylate-amine ligase [Citricoccus sp. SGAir0253]|uniref:glutamate--cysteine ligase n=1 Tax=Citricoccus sp. SGAir0253 TaxID=2567881 RepID=UPI0010CCFAEC|nr:glutamate--cysteine ligase [Citricoccus sp. SGAir0253]QCU77575.1 YbdK family carboxylate-amine ligase [Citricoccus sp. SGAir0253]